MSPSRADYHNLSAWQGCHSLSASAGWQPTTAGTSCAWGVEKPENQSSAVTSHALLLAGTFYTAGAEPRVTGAHCP